MCSCDAKGLTDIKVEYEEVKRFMIDCLSKAGSAPCDTKEFVDALIAADELGLTSHGLCRLERYMNEVRNKICDPKAEPKIISETCAVTYIDGNMAYGPVAANFGMAKAIEKAQKMGISMSVVKRANNLVAASIYTRQAMDQGCIGICFANSSKVLVPTRAKDAALGSNCMAASAPGICTDNFSMDLATSKLSTPHVEAIKLKGGQVPDNCALGPDAKPITDPEAVLQDPRLLPIGGFESTGGYKGYGLAMMVEALTGVLTGSKTGPDRLKYGEEGEADASLTFIAIAPKLFNADFSKYLSDLTKHIRNLEPADPEKPVMVPGDREMACLRRCQAEEAIFYKKEEMEMAEILAKENGVQPLRPKGSYRKDK